MSTIKDLNLAESGERKIRWVEAHMPVLRDIGSDFAREKPFAGLKIALSVHLEAKTAYLCRVLEMGGAEMHVTGSNPLSTQDDVAAALAEKGMDVHAVYGCSDEEYQAHLRSVLSVAPNIIIDDGGDLVHLMHTEFTDLIPQVIGGCEETTTGIHRLRIMDRAGTLRFPMIMVNDADCKHLFDNRYGTGQSVWDGIMRTTNLVVAGKYVLEMGGAEMHVTGSNPLSTQDDVAAALAEKGMDVHAVYGCSDEEYQAHLRSVLSVAPNIIIDDGGDLVHLMHTEFTDLIPQVIGGCEETTTGIHRLRIMDRAGTLRFPMIMVNDADCKHLFDNRYGTGQSVWDGIMRTTNLVVAGKYVVVSGYGWCGKGVALRAKGLGAKVVVTEVDPVRALEAVMDGYEVMPMMDAAAIGDIFVSVTGCKDVITLEHCEHMKDGAIVSNAGHFNVEIDMEALDRCADEIYEARHNIDAYRLPNGKTIYVIAQGRLVNLAAGDGHPAEIMDMSFAVQAMSAEYLVRTRGQLRPGVVSVPAEIDDNIARRKLKAMGVSIDSLSCSQKEYLNG